MMQPRLAQEFKSWFATTRVSSCFAAVRASRRPSQSPGRRGRCLHTSWQAGAGARRGQPSRPAAAEADLGSLAVSVRHLSCTTSLSWQSLCLTPAPGPSLRSPPRPSEPESLRPGNSLPVTHSMSTVYRLRIFPWLTLTRCTTNLCQQRSFLWMWSVIVLFCGIFLMSCHKTLLRSLVLLSTRKMQALPHMSVL